MVRSSCVLVAGLAVLALGGTASSVGVGLVRGAVPAQAHSTPRLFAAVGPGLSVELRSARTGAVVGTAGHLGRSWTNNGFDLSPDGRYVYFTLIPKSPRWTSLLLERLSVSTHRQRLVAHGEEPSVSPDGRLLAYAQGEDRSATIVVRDLASGQRRSISVAGLLGGRSDMLHASLAWFGDGTELAVFESCCAVATSTPAPQAEPRGSSGLRLIVVSVPPHGRLSARLLGLPPGAQLPDVIGTDGTRTDALLVSSLLADDRAAVYRLTIGSSRSTLRRVLTIARSLLVRFAPSGRALLYLVGHNGPDLWSATISNGRLTRRHLLIRNAALDAYAW
jgi:WD40-like Beta Propeller Repeat